MVRGYFFPTDYGWFRFLAEQQTAAGPNLLDEVNFWRPSGVPFRALAQGEPLFFKLKAPHNAIGGFGYFARYTKAPISAVWDAFDLKNGAPSIAALRGQTSRLRNPAPGPLDDYEIGCIMVSSPTFFPRELWVPQPADFPGEAVSGKGYDVMHGEAASIFERCREVERLLRASGIADRAIDPGEKWGAAQMSRTRLGQGTFRLGIVDAYGRACAVSHEHSLPVLEAAHIRPYAGDGTHALENGLLLRLDIHRLFDRGYVTVDPDYRFVVSKRLRQDFGNGKTYDEYHGGRIELPRDPYERPSVEGLRWHNETVFRG